MSHHTDSQTSLQHKAVIGIIWNLFEQVGKRGIGLLLTLLLARFLTPDAFGLVAIVSIFINIANSLMEIGFIQALIRKTKLDAVDYATAFYANLALSLFVYAILYIFAPSIAAFYENEELIVLLRVACLVLLFNSLHMIQVVNLTRDLDFKTQLKITVPASFISGLLAIIMAFTGFGVWSLIAQILTASILTTILYNYMRPWLPVLAFNFKSLQQIFGFGSKLFLASFIDKIFKDVYIVVLARVFDAFLVGHYFFSQRVQQLVSIGLISIVQRVTYPAMAKIQEDPVRLKAAYRKLVRTVVYVVYPSMGMLIILAPHLFNVFLAEEWWEAANYLQLMCIVGFLTPLHAINLNILKVKGRSDLFLYMEIVKKVILITILFFSIRHGIYGVIIGKIINSFVAYIPNSYFSVRLIQYYYLQQLKDISMALLGTIIMLLFMFVLDMMLPTESMYSIFILTPSGMIVYFIYHHLLASNAQTFFIQEVKGILLHGR